MNTNKERILQYINEHPDSSLREIVNSLSAGQSTVDSEVSNLFRLGLLSRTGSKQKYRYSTVPVEASEEQPCLHMSAGMALFNRLLKEVRSGRSNEPDARTSRGDF